MNHHRGGRHAISEDPAGMLRNEVQSAIAKPVLLGQIPRQSLAPSVLTRSAQAIRQVISGFEQPIAHVVVVTVSKALVKEPDALERFRAERAVARAYVIG